MPLRRYAKGLLVLEMLLSVGAIGGGLVLIMAPRGEIMPLPLSALAGSPFETYLGPGLILFAVLGLGPLVAACLVWLRHPLAPGCSAHLRAGTADLDRRRDRHHRLQQRAASAGDLSVARRRHHARGLRLGTGRWSARQAPEDRPSDLIRESRARCAQEVDRGIP